MPIMSCAMSAARFHAARRYAKLASGNVAYVEQGRGSAALFIHGVPLNGFHWRHVMHGLQGLRRCIALDLMGLGYTEIDKDQDVTFPAQARMLLQFIDALNLERVDLVANDSGGAIAQIFAGTHPERLASLTLTNCDVHDGWPPAQVRPLIDAARDGVLAARYEDLLGSPDRLRERFADVMSDPSALTDEAIRVYLQPLLASEERRAAFHRYWLAFDSSQTVAVEPLLRRLHVPTLIVWAMDDAFFGPKWAHWLQRTIPGAVGVVQVAGAKLFFAEDRPLALIAPVRRLWRILDGYGRVFTRRA
jgi:pimeloyl-ACP methyl ester carboxylesterase